MKYVWRHDTNLNKNTSYSIATIFMLKSEQHTDNCSDEVKISTSSCCSSFRISMKSKILKEQTSNHDCTI